jgi:hypothetical protein
MTPLADCPQRFGPAVSFYLAQHLLATLLPDPAIHHLVQLRFTAPFSDGSIRRSLPSFTPQPGGAKLRHMSVYPLNAVVAGHTDVAAAVQDKGEAPPL